MGAKAVVLELIRDPRAQAVDGRCTLDRELRFDVHVLKVDRGRGGDGVAGEDRGVVQLRPLMSRQYLGRLPQRRQLADVLKHPREDVLAGKKLRLLAVRGRLYPLRRPLGNTTIRVTGLVDDGIQGVAREGIGSIDVVQERRAVNWQL